jgi:hypothetical protein
MHVLDAAAVASVWLMDESAGKWMKNVIARKVLIPLIGLCILGVGGELIGSVIGAEPAASARTTVQGE